jgi:sortase A
LQPGDTITLETPIGACTYRVLVPPPRWKPYGNGASFIIKPTDVDVIRAPAIARPGEDPPAGPLLTLTTCHPKGSAAQRLVIQAVLVTDQPPAQPGA